MNIDDISELWLDAAPLICTNQGQRRSAMALAEALDALLTLQAFFAGEGPTYPYPPPHDAAARFFRTAHRLMPDNLCVEAYKYEAEMHYAGKRFWRHYERLCKVGKRKEEEKEADKP